MKQFLPILFISVLACSAPDEPLTSEKIIDNAIKKHGLDQLDGRKIEFDFRDRHYSLVREPGLFTYTRSFQDSLGYVEDILVNSSEFKRLVDGTQLEVDEEWTGKYSNSVNSVLYFVQLPYTLTDAAARKKYRGVVDIKGSKYHEIEVRFSEEGGGKDFEDVFLYWFQAEDFSMDYFAYSYITDGGGVRFRSAINQREVKDIAFQDYINYKPEVKTTPLDSMRELYNSDKLIELSRILNENVIVSRN